MKGFDPLQYIDRKEARRYDLFAQLALAAAHQAITQAGLEGRFPSPERTGVVIGSGIGGMQTYEENCSLYLTKGPDRVSPFFVPMFIPDIAAGLVSIRYGLKGPNFATVSACASSAHAIGESFNMIRHGVADAMVTGGSEGAITGLTVAAFANMKALSTRNDSPETASRPFDKDRDGFVLGDGGAMVVLESLEHAERRGAQILGEVLGYGSSADAYHITSPAEARGRRPAGHARLPRGRQDRSQGRGLHQRPRHVHAAGRHRRDRGGQGGLRRAGPQAGLRVHQVHDRPPARRGRGARVRRLAAGVHLRRHSTHHQSVHSRPASAISTPRPTARSSAGWMSRSPTPSGSAATT